MTETTTDTTIGGETYSAPSIDTGSEPNLKQYYWKLREYARMVCRGTTNALLLEAGPGIGKSYQIIETLEHEVGPRGYTKMSGYSSPLALYQKLYEASGGQVLFLDDIEGLLENDKALSLLKQATWSERGQRFVEWQSTTSLVEAPEKFAFNGRIIMCFNETPSDDLIFDSLRDRCLPYEISFTYEERLDIMHEVAKAPYEGLRRDERDEVVAWVKRNTSPDDGTDVNLRLMFHAFDMMRHDRDRWQELATELLSDDSKERGTTLSEFEEGR